jgi:hypothetical protein
MFLVFKMSFVVDIFAFFDLATFELFLKKFGNFFSYHLLTSIKEKQTFCKNKILRSGSQKFQTFFHFESGFKN